MSHIHDIGGFGAAASDYQEYLERMRARRRAAGASKDSPLLTFDSAIDTEREPERDPDDGGDQGGDSAPEGESRPRYA